MKKWEYNSCRLERNGASGWRWEDGSNQSIIERLDELGAKGWDLVSVLTPDFSGSKTYLGFGGTANKYLFIFKRPIEE